MKMNFKRYTLSLLSVLTVFAILSQFTVLAKTGTVVTNKGVRHTVCVELSAQAVKYYSDNKALYDNVSVLKGGSANCLTTVDSALFDELHDLMSGTMTKTVKYSDLPTYWAMTDANNGGSTYHYFYADVTVSGQTINREHVWPKSHASFHEKDGGADPHHLRPTIRGVNSSRGDKLMGNVEPTDNKYSKYSFQNKVVLEHSNSLVEVNDNIKGDVARILLYVYCRWEEPNLFMDTPNPVVGAGSGNQNDGEKVIESLETLLEWCKMDPVDTWEMARNDQCENLVGNRNVFIDYPEYAWLLFGKELPEDMTTPSGEAKETGSNQGGNDNNNDENQGGNQGGTNTDTPSGDTNNDNNNNNDTNNDNDNNNDSGSQGGIENKPNNGGKPYDPNAVGGQQIQTDGGDEFVLEPWVIVLIIGGAVVVIGGIVVAAILITKKVWKKK